MTSPTTPDVSAKIPRRRTKRGDETRRVLIQAAIGCLHELGYAGTSVEAVMTKAGVSRGSLLNQFPTRLALMAATVEAAMDAMIADTGARFEAIGDPVERYRRLCDLFWETQNIPESVAVTEVLLAARRDTALASELGRVAARVEELIDSDVARRAREAGARDIEACIVHARMLILSLRGMTLELMFDSDRKVILKALDEIRAMHAVHCDRVLAAT